MSRGLIAPAGSMRHFPHESHCAHCDWDTTAALAGAAADAALSLLPDLKVLFITGYAENAVIGNGQLAPNMALVTKPFAMDALAKRIGDMLP